MSLENIRKKIDALDHDILKLLNERAELGLRTKKLKPAIHDDKREAEILDQAKAIARAYNLLDPDFVEKAFRTIVEETRRIQGSPRTLIGFQGDHGAFGEEAVRRHDAQLVPIPCREFADVFDGVESGDLDLGIVPVENSLGGAIAEVNELLIRRDLKVRAAIRLKINHCLLVAPEANYQEIRIVYSHPQALSQCRAFLSRHQLEARPFYDTAGAAKMLAREKPKMAAAIASRLCGELYNLEVIKENIQDHQENFTRFLVLSKDDRKDAPEKCSIVFSTPHRAGALFAILQIFTEAGINLTRIESLPDRADPGNYVFFLDFQINDARANLDAILENVGHKTKMFKYLGCYREEVFA